MPTSLRVVVVLTVLGGWLAVVIVQLFGFFLGKSGLPSVALMGVPSAVILAVAPWGKRKSTPPRATTPAESTVEGDAR